MMTCPHQNPLQHFDVDGMPAGAGETRVPCQQWTFECFGEGKIGGVVGRDVVAEPKGAPPSRIRSRNWSVSGAMVNASTTAALSMTITRWSANRVVPLDPPALP